MSRNVKRKAVPRFRDEEEERTFWATQDSAAHIDWSKGERVVLPNLKPSLKTISLRLSERIAQERRLPPSPGKKRA